MARLNDTFHLEFETREMPGKIQYVEVTINQRITSDPKKMFYINLRDHPLYPALVRYVKSNLMASTLCLELNDWDLCVDTAGNIALATEPYAIAQDVASACKTFLGECWYNTSYGIPYLQQVLGQLPSLSVIKALLTTAASTVPGCGNPIVFITSFQNRQLIGQVQFIDSLGQAAVAAIAVPVPMQLADNAGNALFDNIGNPLFSG